MAVLRILALWAVVSDALPVGSTQADVQAQYEQVAKTWEKLQGSFQPVAEASVQANLPALLESVVGTVTTFVEKLPFAPHMASIGKMIDNTAFGPDAFKPSDPRAGNGITVDKCGKGENGASCVQVVGAAKAVIDSFKGNAMAVPPFVKNFVPGHQKNAQVAAPTEPTASPEPIAAAAATATATKAATGP